jgi:hypothetical protein
VKEKNNLPSLGNAAAEITATLVRAIPTHNTAINALRKAIAIPQDRYGCIATELKGLAGVFANQAFGATCDTAYLGYTALTGTLSRNFPQFEEDRHKDTSYHGE